MSSEIVYFDLPTNKTIIGRYKGADIFFRHVHNPYNMFYPAKSEQTIGYTSGTILLNPNSSQSNWENLKPMNSDDGLKLVKEYYKNYIYPQIQKIFPDEDIFGGFGIFVTNLAHRKIPGWDRDSWNEKAEEILASGKF